MKKDVKRYTIVIPATDLAEWRIEAETRGLQLSGWLRMVAKEAIIAAKKKGKS